MLTAIKHISLVGVFAAVLLPAFIVIASKPRFIDTDIRDFANKCREYIYRQEQRDFPKRNFDAHMQLKEVPLW